MCGDLTGVTQLAEAAPFELGGLSEDPRFCSVICLPAAIRTREGLTWDGGRGPCELPGRGRTDSTWAFDSDGAGAIFARQNAQ
jgi:hypothetical protein